MNIDQAELNSFLMGINSEQDTFHEYVLLFWSYCEIYWLSDAAIFSISSSDSELLMML